MTLQYPIRRFTFAGMFGGALGGMLIPTLYLVSMWLQRGGGSRGVDGWTRAAVDETVTFLGGFGAIGALVGALLGGLVGLGFGIVVARRGLPRRPALALAAAGALIGWIGLGIFFRVFFGAFGGADLIERITNILLFSLNPLGALCGAIGGWVGGRWVESRRK